MLRYIVSFSGPPIFEIPRVYAGVNELCVLQLKIGYARVTGVRAVRVRSGDDTGCANQNV